MVRRVRIKGLWSIAEADIELGKHGRIDVVLGANGAGKSSLLNVFRMLRAIAGRGLAGFVASMGGANSVLHYGAKTTPMAEIEVGFEGSDGVPFGYSAVLMYAAPDRLVFADEAVRRGEGLNGIQVSFSPGGHAESELRSYIAASAGHIRRAALAVIDHLERLGSYHLHDTSLTAGMRQTAPAQDTAYLRPDGSNLAAFLMSLAHFAPKEYALIRSTVARVFPRFDDFVFAGPAFPHPAVLLRWRERGNAYEFGPHHLSDGTLRFIAFATLLLQPAAHGEGTTWNFPSLVVIDEPELGLHPAALALLAGLLRAFPGQLLVATQSPDLLGLLVATEEELGRLLLIDRDERGSVFRRPDVDALKRWLEDYVPAELWMHGLLGALP